MKPTHRIAFAAPVTLLLAVLCLTSTPARSQQPSVPERVAALKATTAASQAVLRQYEWIETTTILLKGEEKSSRQQRCYYGADGGIQKLDVTAAPAPEKRRGVRGRIAERKTEELTSTMKQAVALVKSYVPLDPARIQAAKDMGKVSLDLIEPGKRARLNFKDYLKSGDAVGVEIDLANNRALGLSVSSYLEKPSDAVVLEVRMGQLNDGTGYPKTVTLDAKAEKLRVAVEHSGYRRTGN